jgi:ABC-type transport system involved in multi-copper enzyme maturation permease subunit
MPNLRLIKAEVLKLRRRPGMLSVAFGLTLGLLALAYLGTAIQHGGNPAKYDAAGGAKGFKDSLEFLSMMAFIMAAIVGSTAGSQDIDSGVFRDLAATGRSRTALFASRAGGAWLLVLPIVGLTAAFTGVASIALAGSLDAPGAGALIAGTVGVVVAGALSSAMAVGLSALVGSRGPVIGILLALYLAVSPLLIGMRFLGDARWAIPEVAVSRIGDLQPAGDVDIALVTAVLVVIAWASAALGLGAWRTRTREI